MVKALGTFARAPLLKYSQYVDVQQNLVFRLELAQPCDIRLRQTPSFNQNAAAQISHLPKTVRLLETVP